MPPPKPPAPKRPGKVEVFRALYKYEAQHVDELSFDEGDLIYVKEKKGDGWYVATINGKNGLIPGNYVGEAGMSESVDNPLHEAAKRGNLPYLQESLSNGVSPNALDKAGSTPLHWAARGGHTECVSALLASGKCRVDVQNKLGDTPLHNAAWKGNAEVVGMLLEAGADKNIKNENGELAYNLAKDPQCGSLLMNRRHADDDEYGDSDEDED